MPISRKGMPAEFDPSREGKLSMSRNNKPYLFLNPDEKGRKCAVELREGCSVFTGEKLKPSQKAYRKGYLDAKKDSAKAFKSNERKKKR